MEYYLYKRDSKAIDKVRICLFYSCEHCHSNIVGYWELDKSLWENNDYYLSVYVDGKGNYGAGTTLNISLGHDLFFSDCVYTLNELKKKLMCYEKTATLETFQAVKKLDKNKPLFQKFQKIFLSKEYENAVQSKKEIASFLEMNICPICNTNWADKQVFGVVQNAEKLSLHIEGKPIKNEIKTSFGSCNLQHDWDKIDEMFEHIKNYRITENGQFAENRLNQLVKKYDVCMEKKQVPFVFNVEKLREYICNVLTVEKNVFALSERLKRLYAVEKNLQENVEASETLATKSIVEKLRVLTKEYENLKKKDPSSKILLENIPITLPKKPDEPQKPIEPLIKKPGFFNKKKVLLENSVLMDHYRQSFAEYEQLLTEYKSKKQAYDETVIALKEKQMIEYSAKLEKEKNKHLKLCENLKTKIDSTKEERKSIICKKGGGIATPQKVELEFVKKEIEVAEQLLEKYCSTRNELYSYELVFEKYRNLVAISTLYECLCSGRCETLEGTNGAYNIYENEIRMNTVISQLTTVVEKLEEIKQGQFTLYMAVNEVNNNLQKLNGTLCCAVNSLFQIEDATRNMTTFMSEISKNTEVIAYNTEMTAFYTKKNAELTNALGYMVALS